MQRAHHDVAFVIGDLGPGGTQRVLSAVSEALAERGVRICIVTLAPPEDDFFPLPEGISRLVIGGNRESSTLIDAVAANLRRLLALRRALKQAGAPTVMSLIGVTNILTVLAAFGLGLRIVISERNDPARQSLGRAWDGLRRLLYRRADLVTANSQAALASLGSYVPRQKLAYLPNPLPRPPDSHSPDQGGTASVILNVGRLAPQKAQDVLIAAFARLAPQHPDWQLEVLGEGEAEAALKHQAAALGIAERVHFPGLSNDPFSHYRSAAIFALPSRFEGTPNALLEAMSCGLAVIVSDAPGGMQDLVEDDVNGLVVPVDDEAALADRLRLLIGDPERRQRLGQAARARLSESDPDQALVVWERILGLAPVPRPS